MRLLLVLMLTIITSFVHSQQEQEYNYYKVHIGESALMCPNLGPKLKVNMRQIGAEILSFNIDTSTMLVKVDKENEEANSESYIAKIVQLTGYPDNLVKVDKIEEAEVNEILITTKK